MKRRNENMGEPRTTVSIYYSYYEKLKEIMKREGLPSVAATIYWLVTQYFKKEGEGDGQQ